MGVSKNNGTPKWMVYNGKPYLLMDDLGGVPIIFGLTPICWIPTRHDQVYTTCRSLTASCLPLKAIGGGNGRRDDFFLLGLDGNFSGHVLLNFGEGS